MTDSTQHSLLGEPSADAPPKSAIDEMLDFSERALMEIAGRKP